MKISGKVVDMDNVPLMGANITLRSGAKSGKVGTSTDFDGNFTLESDDFVENDNFEVSYIGFVKQNFKAKDLKDKKIALQEMATELDEIVLVGTRPTSKNGFKQHLAKNKYFYAGGAGLLGLALLLISIKKLN